MGWLVPWAKSISRISQCKKYIVPPENNHPRDDAGLDEGGQEVEDEDDEVGELELSHQKEA